MLSSQSVEVYAQLGPEPRLGSRIPVNPEKFSSERTQRLVGDFAACVIGKKRSLASAFVLDRSGLGLDDKYQSLADGDCLGEWMSELHPELALAFQGDSMRFALAEALLHSELDGISPDQIENAALLPIPQPAEESYAKLSADEREKSRASDAAAIIWYKFGDCAVRASPDAAKAMLEATPGSAGEGAAIQVLMPVLGSCLEKGAQITLNRTKLRGAIAFSYYSLAHAPRAFAH